MFIDSIKSVCRKRYKILPSMCCNVLAGENGPSCFSTKQIPDFKITCTSSEELKHHKGNSTHHQGKIILRRDVEYCLFPNLAQVRCQKWLQAISSQKVYQWWKCLSLERPSRKQALQVSWKLQHVSNGSVMFLICWSNPESTPCPKVSPPQEIQSDLRPNSLACTLAKKC